MLLILAEANAFNTSGAYNGGGLRPTLPPRAIPPGDCICIKGCDLKPIVSEILFEIESADLRPIPHFPSLLHRSLWRWQLSHPSLRGIIKIAAFVKAFHACRSLPELKHKPITKTFTRALRDNLRENVMRK